MEDASGCVRSLREVHVDEAARFLADRSADCHGDQQPVADKRIAFLPGLQRAVLLQSGQRELEEEVWQRLFALGKQLQRAGYCAGNCQGQALVIGRQGSCVIVRWDANSNGSWDNSASENDSTGFRLESGALETLRGATSCEGKGWEKLTDPDRLTIAHLW
jgi:prepilin peptidase dependent protein B